MGNSQKNNGPMIGHNTNVITAQCLEGGFVRIPNQGHLRTAWFGQASGSHGRNVTKKASQYIRKNFKEGRDHVLWASTEWWGDPWSGSKKKLLITYTMPVGLTVHEPNQHNRTITANEGQYVSIPMDVSVIKAFWGKPSEPKKKNVTDKVKKILKSCGRRPFCATRKTLGNPWFNSGSLVLILECSEPIKVYQDNASIPVADVVVEVVDTQSDFEKKSVQSTPVQSMPVQSMPVQAVPVQSMPVQAVPVQSMPVQAVPVQSMSEQYGYVLNYAKSAFTGLLNTILPTDAQPSSAPCPVVVEEVEEDEKEKQDETEAYDLLQASDEDSDVPPGALEAPASVVLRVWLPNGYSVKTQTFTQNTSLIDVIRISLGHQYQDETEYVVWNKFPRYPFRDLSKSLGELNLTDLSQVAITKNGEEPTFSIRRTTT
eukprot:g5954.t1